EEEKNYPFFKYLHKDDFSRQLDFFEKEYGFVSQIDFINCFTTGKPANGVVLTFDDGLKDHIEFVLPELQRRNQWGIFYVCTGVYQTHQLLDVHATHLLLGRLGGEKLLNILLKEVDETMLADKANSSFRQNTYQAQTNDEATTEVKRIL